MPAGYVRMRDAFKREGLSDRAAKKKAARIYNAAHPGDPVTRGYDRKRKKKRSKLPTPSHKD